MNNRVGPFIEYVEVAAMQVFSRVEDIRQFRRQSTHRTWGLVPTMGFLHEGHLSLVRRARRDNDQVAVSIFINPMQFDNSSDLAVYPKDIERDLALLESEGVDIVWTPTPEIVYPAGYLTYVEVEKLMNALEGAARPGHFRGVTTMVAKLFNLFQPRLAYFGQKDAQQAVIIKKMVQDLCVDLDIVVMPTVREDDGLAMSSRNVRLSAKARQQANCLYLALQAASAAFEAGETGAKSLKKMMREVLSDAPDIKIDYLSIADPETLEELEEVAEGALASLAVFLDGVRLIDNVLLTRQKSASA